VDWGLSVARGVRVRQPGSESLSKEAAGDAYAPAGDREVGSHETQRIRVVAQRSALRRTGKRSAATGPAAGTGQAVNDGRVTVVYLAPRYATAIRMIEPISSVVVGDPSSFSAEHSEQEPNLVFVKPLTAKPAETNLLVSTTKGHQVSLLLISRGETKNEQQPVDLLLRYKPAGRFLVEPADYPSALVAETASLTEPRNTTAVPAAATVQPSPQQGDSGPTVLDTLLERQRRRNCRGCMARNPGSRNRGRNCSARA